MSTESMVTQAALEPCPNPWCYPSPELGPTFVWKSPGAALVECYSCGLQGPIFSPVIRNDDGEVIGSQDAEAEAIAAWNTRTTPSPEAGPVEVERIAALRSRDAGADAMPSDLLTEFGQHVGWELSYAGWDDEAEWQVHQVNGGRNDREWTLIGTGQTPAAAIRAALSETRP